MAFLFFKKTTVQELEEIATAEPAIQKAFKAESLFTQDEINRRKYELREKYQRDRVAQINYAVKQALSQEEEKRVISWIKKGKTLEDILDFTVLPQERVQQLWNENQP